MKTWKLVSGILTIIFFVIVSMQSCAAGVLNAMEANGGSSGSMGILVALFMLAGGIVSIATRNLQKKSGNISLIILFGFAALLGYTGYGNYSDLLIWASWCLVNAVIALVSLVRSNKGM